MRSDLTGEQKAALITRRNEVAGLLLAVGDRCPGCWEPVSAADADFHHFPWRQSGSYCFELDMMLYSPSNGVLAHRACHMKEGWDFQLRAALLLWHRVGIGRLRKFKAQVEKLTVAEWHWPKALLAVLDTMQRDSSRQYCPACFACHLHEFRNPEGRAGAPINGSGPLKTKALCWSCLRVFPAGTDLKGGPG